jgi:hypothetical protein
MPQYRNEPPKDGMTKTEYGQQFARDVLLERITDVQEGDSVEVDYITENGLEVSKVGTVQERTETPDGTDLKIHTGGPTATCYLHVNQETRNVFFADDSRKAGDRELLQFDPK